MTDEARKIKETLKMVKLNKKHIEEFGPVYASRQFERKFMSAEDEKSPGKDSCKKKN